jgi:hypothetical protein
MSSAGAAVAVADGLAVGVSLGCNVLVAVGGAGLCVAVLVGCRVAVAVAGAVVSVATGVEVAGTVEGGGVLVGCGVLVAGTVDGGGVLVGAVVAVLIGWVAVDVAVAAGRVLVGVGRGLSSSSSPQAAKTVARNAAASSRLRNIGDPLGGGIPGRMR